MSKLIDGIDDALIWCRLHEVEYLVESIDTDGPTFFLKDFHAEELDFITKLQGLTTLLTGMSAKRKTYRNGNENYSVQFPTWRLVWNVIVPERNDMPVEVEVITL